MQKASSWVVVLAAAGAAVCAAKVLPGDARRGEALIRTQNCVACHRVGGEGGRTGPDLGKARGRSYTPSSMASRMWNHAPAMWTAMEKQGAQRPALDEQQAADLYAYFHAIRFFDRPGDAARGSRVFSERRCAECHGRTKSNAMGAPPVAAWKAVASPIEFAQQLWNHAPRMEQAMAAKKMKWARLTGAELTDIVVYVQSLPETRGQARSFVLTADGRGAAVFAEKGCKGCHQGRLLLEGRLVAGTLTDFAAAMWNHAPQMSAAGADRSKPAQLTAEEMRDIVSYFWYGMVFAERGDAGKGRELFAKKQCGTCHGDRASGAPDLAQRLGGRDERVRAITLVSTLWRHGPAMLEGMKAKQLSWPEFSETEMRHLIAYLESLRAPGAAGGN